MKIAHTAPFKAALVIASITTIGMLALSVLDTEVIDYGVPVPVATDDVDDCRELTEPQPQLDIIETAPPAPTPQFNF